MTKKEEERKAAQMKEKTVMERFRVCAFTVFFLLNISLDHILNISVACGEQSKYVIIVSEATRICGPRDENQESRKKSGEGDLTRINF